MTDTAPTQDPALQQVVTDAVQDAPAVVKDVETANVTGLVADASKAYEQIKPLVPTLVSEVKAGYKTTEFWLVVVWEALTQSSAIHLPGTYSKLIAGAAGIISYVLSRGIAKRGL